MASEKEVLKKVKSELEKKAYSEWKNQIIRLSKVDHIFRKEEVHSYPGYGVKLGALETTIHTESEHRYGWEDNGYGSEWVPRAETSRTYVLRIKEGKELLLTAQCEYSVCHTSFDTDEKDKVYNFHLKNGFEGKCELGSRITVRNEKYEYGYRSVLEVEGDEQDHWLAIIYHSIERDKETTYLDEKAKQLKTEQKKDKRREQKCKKRAQEKKQTRLNRLDKILSKK